MRAYPLRSLIVSCILLTASGLLPNILCAQAIRLKSAVVRPRSITGNSTVSVAVSTSNVAFSLVPKSTATANTPIVITTTIALPLLTTLNLYGSFTSSTAALTGASSSSLIPSSAVFGLVPTGLPTTYTAFTQTNPIGGASASLKLVSLSSIISGFTRSDSLSLLIDLTSLPQLPADTYVGTLIIQAQIF